MTMFLPPRDATFTVIIPTKDRAEYLRHTLRSCSLQQDDNFEVVVSDDGSRDHTREVVEEAARRDPRIRYTTPAPRSGMRDNFEHALDQVKPGYVMALGGDDGLLPYGIRGMREALAETGQELLAWPAPTFFYPRVRFPTGQLVMPVKRLGLYHGLEVVRSEDYLARQARTLRYLEDVYSPMSYVKGLTSTRLVERVRSRSQGGRFYSCPTPDGYSGIVLAGEVETYAWSGVPFSIYGASPSSQGLAYLISHEEARRQTEAFFREASPMHAELAGQPYSPLITLMTADYLLTCQSLPGWPGKVPNLDWKHLVVQSLGEIADGLFAEVRVARELAILDRIAEHHGLGEFFREKVKSTRRNARAPLEGDAISPRSVYLDTTGLGMENIVDAAFFIHLLVQGAPKLSAGRAWRALVKSVRYRLLSFRRGGSFPPESEWHTPPVARRQEA